MRTGTLSTRNDDWTRGLEDSFSQDDGRAVNRALSLVDPGGNGPHMDAWHLPVDIRSRVRLTNGARSLILP